jgi:Cdc6-like AAA superfamily ATPase
MGAALAFVGGTCTESQHPYDAGKEISMAIPGIDQDRISEVLRQHLTPSAHIVSPERLFGRGKKLIQIERAFNSNGRHVFIFGDRGVGKTSLAMTAAYLHQPTADEPVYVLCSESSTFADILFAIGNNALPLRERMESGASSRNVGMTFAGFGGSFKPGDRAVPSFGAPTDINEASNIIRYINERRPKGTVVVIDELERLRNEEDKVKLAEFVNSISSVQTSTKFILSGIGHTVEDLLGAHRSATRKLETIELERISHDELWKIVSTVADELGVTVDRDYLIRASILSDGFPHYVHLIAESLFWAMFDDEAVCIAASAEHFRAAVTGAIERTEVEHKSAYRRATEKVKNTREYELALWSLADKTETRRQLDSIYSDSYLRIIRSLGDDYTKVEKNKLNQRLLSLKSPSHGEVLRGYGSGWFAFSETILRGYVRLMAEHQGISLARGLAS